MKYNTSKNVKSTDGSKPDNIVAFCSATRSNWIKPSPSVSQLKILLGWMAIAGSNTSTLKVALYSVTSPQAFVKSIFSV